MSNRYNLLYFEATFKKYLLAVNVGASTVKSYLSDLHFFLSWLQSYRGVADLELSDAPEVFSHETVRSYHLSLLSSQTASATYNRRLSSLRHFFSFCISQSWLISNPVHEFDTHTKRDGQNEVIHRYSKHLIAQKMDTSEIERHIDVIRSLIIN